MKRKASRRAAAAKRRRSALSMAKLDALIGEAIVDAYDESEQMMGFHSVIEDELAIPFETEALGVMVTVEGVELTERDDIVAICAKEGRRQRIRLLDLPLPSPPPKGWEWIEAFRRWAGAGRESPEEE